MKFRVWTLGSLEHGIIPKKETITKLQDQIKLLKEGSIEDIVWGPDLKVQEFDIDFPSVVIDPKNTCSLNVIEISSKISEETKQKLDKFFKKDE
jgi:hypothetical protein